MKINASEISALIKEQIKSYRQKVDSDDVGTVISAWLASIILASFALAANGIMKPCGLYIGGQA